MDLYQYYEKALNWQSKISSSSRSYFDYSKALLAILTLTYLTGTAVLTVFFPKTGDLNFMKITISTSNKDLFTLIATVIGIFFSIGLLPSLKKWYQPSSLRYRLSADKIIKQLKQDSIIDERKENRLKSISARLLGAVEVENPAVDSQEMLLRASYELANEMENKQG